MKLVLIKVLMGAIYPSGDMHWGCWPILLTGAMGSDLGTGLQYTNDIMIQYGTPGIASRQCYDLVRGGFSDWYLPSSIETFYLYLNRALLEDSI